MADKNIVKTKKADRRRRRVRGKVFGTSARPRLTVAKSLNNVFAQIIDDEKGITLVSAATNSQTLKKKLSGSMSKSDAAKFVGQAIAELAREKGIEKVVFDRNCNIYHGRIKAVADGAREAGLVF